MSRDHFAKMYKSTSKRHDSLSDSEQFNSDVKHLCGMLYSVITLKAFFPKSPGSAMSNNPIKDPAAGGDQKQ